MEDSDGSDMGGHHEEVHDHERGQGGDHPDEEIDEGQEDFTLGCSTESSEASCDEFSD